jgi:hypothetical protein
MPMEFISWKLISNCADVKVPRRDDNVLDGPKRTVLQIMSTLSIHDACVMELETQPLDRLPQRSWRNS